MSKALTTFFLVVLLTSPRQVFSQDEKAENKEKVVKLSGSVNAYAQLYGANNLKPRRERFTWRISGNPTLRVKDFSLPLYFLVGDYQDPLKQNFNRFGITPSYKWAKIYLGHVNMDLSPVVFSRVPILGAGFEIHPSLIRIGFIYGRLEKEIEHDSLALVPSHTTFKRTGYAAKLGFGSKTNYVDLIYFKAKDQKKSIDYLPDRDTTLTPEENAALGISAYHEIKGKVFLEVDVGLSLFSSNTLSKPYDDSDVAVANEFKPFITLRSSTRFLTAVQSSLEYRNRSFSIGLKYDRIDPEYQTLGTYYFRNDVERFVLSSKWVMAKSKVRVAARIGVERNNLLDSKTTRSVRTIGMLNVFYRINVKTNVALFYTNHIYNFSDIRGELTDTISINQLVNVLTASVNHSHRKEDKTHQISMNTNYQLSQQNRDSDEARSVNTVNSSFHYNLGFNEKRLNLISGWEWSQTWVDPSGTVRFGPIAGLGHSAFDRKLYWSARTSFTWIQESKELKNIVYRPYLTIRYRPVRKHTITLRTFLIITDSHDPSVTSFREVQGDLRYAVWF